ncbi:ASCH domain-containing protein [Escherichia albertii]|uniref:ASCH domain-containing protein n=1 Tax=Escherichia albertii TaxID=208962 RepID=UPI000CF61E90|nr:ASCH domain-containing protein [Escherichia albertii]
MVTIEEIKRKYPSADAWQMGDSPELASELAGLIKKGVKTASCGSLISYLQDESAPKIGNYSIILDGQNVPVCVIRLVSMRLVRFCDVTEVFARKEGEGDLSLEYWQKEHQRFFVREGYFSEDMELIAEEFEVVEILQDGINV